MNMFEQLARKAEEMKTAGKGSPVLLHSNSIQSIESSGKWPVSFRVDEKWVSGYIKTDNLSIRGHYEAVPFAGYVDVEPNYGYAQIGHQGDYVTVYLNPKDLVGVQIEGFEQDKKTGYLKGRVNCRDIENHSLGKSFSVCESVKLQDQFETSLEKSGITMNKTYRENAQVKLYQLGKLEKICQAFFQKYMSLPEEEKESASGQSLKEKIESVTNDIEKNKARCEETIESKPYWGFAGMYSMLVDAYGADRAPKICSEIVYQLQYLDVNNKNVDWEYVYDQVKDGIQNRIEFKTGKGFDEDGFTNLKPSSDFEVNQKNDLDAEEEME